MKNPIEQYKERRKKYQTLYKSYESAANKVSNFRLGTFIVGAALVIFLQLQEFYLLSVVIAFLFLSLFIYLIVKHQQAIDQKNYNHALFQINDTSLQRLQGEWNSFSDTGKEFIDEEHSYSQDLDVFGRGSLFQWINCTTTFMGRTKLRDILTDPCKEKEEIEKRQQAIEELADKLNFRQKLMAEGMTSTEKLDDLSPLIKWSKESSSILGKAWLVAAVQILPVITLALIILAITSESVPFLLPLLAVGVHVALLSFKHKERVKMFSQTDSARSQLKAHSKMIKLLERERFKSHLLKEVQGNFLSKNGNTASEQMVSLEKVVDSISLRHSQLYVVINLFLLWDYRCQMALERWRTNSGDSLEKWLESIAQAEALSSLAVIRYDNPTWAIPEICTEKSIFVAQEMGHPLLTDKRVANDLKLKEPVSVLLITGSNMSGKSTLLRTAGINLVLAYMGAPVCAKTFKCSLMNIYTVMRVSDNLEKNISSFYAEILRIKKIVQASKISDRQVFFLLDEIFKGTNSLDRHTGAKVLINKLSHEGSMGLVSTHDLELGSLERENAGVRNYHFREYFEGEKLCFDYKLRPGLSTTRNAQYLMKIAGIEQLED